MSARSSVSIGSPLPYNHPFMYRIALQMLMRDRGKYLSLVLGVAFAVLLITQQASIFMGLLKRATGFLQNMGQPDLYITDAHIRYIMEVRPLSDQDLYRIRSIPGIAWAEPFFATRAKLELPDGRFKSVELLGIDRATMIGRPPQITEGRLEDLRLPDAVLIEESARKKLPGIKVGDRLRLNDRRAVVVGYCRAKLGFESNVSMYSTYDNAIQFVPTGRRQMSFILAKTKDPSQIVPIASQIQGRYPHLAALTHQQAVTRTIKFILMETGIGINFGITVVLGLVVGLIVSAATLYQFTLDNLRHYAVLKAMGTSDRRLVGMILLQAVTAGLIGFGLGVGLGAVFAIISRRPGAELAAFFPWQLLVGALLTTLVFVSLGSWLSLRRVLKLEPAVVFR